MMHPESGFYDLSCLLSESVCLCELEYDSSGVANDYRFLDANLNFEAMAGVAGDPVAGKLASVVFTLEHFDALVAIAEQGGKHNFESPLMFRGRVYHLAAASYEKGRFVLAAQDITERRRAEKALARAEHDYRTIFEWAVHGIFQSTRSGGLLQVNPAIAEMFGYADPQEMLAHVSCLGKMHYVDAEDRRAMISQLDREGAVRRLRVRMKRRDGSDFWAHITARLVKVDGKANIHGFMEDITDLIRTEQELEERKRQLMQADKMVSLGILAAGVAHEINNPNNLIMLNTPILMDVWQALKPRLNEMARQNGDFLLSGVPYSEMREHVPALLKDILQASDRIAGIVREMKECTRQDGTRLDQAVDLHGVIDFSVRLLAYRFNDAALIRVIRGDAIPRLRGNARQLEQVVVNLLLNAIEASTAAAGAVEAGVEVKTCHDPASNLVHLIVRDHGCGIGNDAMDHVTDPFFTTKQDTGGLGLGLSIASSIIKAHGGRLRFAPTPGGGTSAMVELPVPCRDQGV